MRNMISFGVPSSDPPTRPPDGFKASGRRRSKERIFLPAPIEVRFADVAEEAGLTAYVGSRGR